MFDPRVPCTITKIGNRDLYGQEVEGASYSEICQPVRLRKDRFHSTVRADSSASRGGADEERADIIVLMRSNTKAALGDKLVVGHVTVRVNNVHPRYTVLGAIDHYEVRGELWG